MTEQTQAWFEFSKCVEQFAAHVFELARQNLKIDRTQLLSLALLLRTSRHVRAMRVLEGAGHFVEMRIIARCCYENVFVACALASEGGAEIAEKVITSQITMNIKAAKDLLLWLKTQDDKTDVAAQLDKVVAEILEDHERMTELSLKAAAEAGAVAQGYNIYRSLSGDAAHPSAASLTRHFEVHAEHVNFFTEPKVSDQEKAASAEYGISGLLVVAGAAAKVCGLKEVNQKFEELRNKFTAISGR